MKTLQMPLFATLSIARAVDFLNVMLCYAVMLLPFDHGQQAVSLSEVETAMARQGPQTERRRTR